MCKCERCHCVTANGPHIYHTGKNRDIQLCVNCYRFISQLFDDVIDEYVLRKE